MLHISSRISLGWVSMQYPLSKKPTRRMLSCSGVLFRASLEFNICWHSDGASWPTPLLGASTFVHTFGVGGYVSPDSSPSINDSLNFRQMMGLRESNLTSHLLNTTPLAVLLLRSSSSCKW